MKEVNGYIRFEKEIECSHDSNLFVIVDRDKIDYKKVVKPLEAIIQEDAKKINDFYKKRHSGNRASAKPNIEENGPIIGHRFTIESAGYYNSFPSGDLKLDPNILKKKVDDVSKDYGLWKVPFICSDLLSSYQLGINSTLRAYVDLLATKKKGRIFIPSHFKFEGSLKDIVESIEYLGVKPGDILKAEKNLRKLRKNGHKKFLFEKAIKHDIVTNNYGVGNKGNGLLKDIFPKLDKDIEFYLTRPMMMPMNEKIKMDFSDYFFELGDTIDYFTGSADKLGGSEKGEKIGKSIRKISQNENLQIKELFYSIASNMISKGISRGDIQNNKEVITLSKKLHDKYIQPQIDFLKEINKDIEDEKNCETQKRFGGN